MQIKKLALAAATMLGLMGVTAVSRADDKKDITALYTKLSKAVINKDVKGVMATGTEDFSYTEAGKTMTGEQISSQMGQQFQMVKGTPECKFTITSCKISGKTAVVLSNDYSKMQIPGQDGKPHTLVSTGSSKDLLVKTEKGWLMKSVTIVTSKMTLDGKPFDPSKAMPDAK